MRYFMHDKELSLKKREKVKKYFDKIKKITMNIRFLGNMYEAIIDVESFAWFSNFDCFNCLTNCCVQFPYDFNSKARKLILDNIKEYDELTKAVSILKEEGMLESEIRESIKKDQVLIPEKYKDKVFNRCTCSCIYVDRSLCALHKLCIDKNYSLEEIIETKPLWCSIYPLEILIEENQLYIFVPTKKNNYLSMNDSDFPCMDIEKSKSPYFRRENPIGFLEEDYKPFILSYYSILKYIFGNEFVERILKELNLKNLVDVEVQYLKSKIS